MFAVIKMENLRECIKLPVVDVIFLVVYRWSKAIEYFLRIVLLNTFFAALNILRCNLGKVHLLCRGRGDEDVKGRGGAPKYFRALKGGALKVLDILMGGLQTFQSFCPAGAWSVHSHHSKIVNRIDDLETH